MTTLVAVYGSQQIELSIQRDARRATEIVVLPSGEVEVRAPMDSTTQQIERLVEKRGRWILRQQKYFEQFRPRTPARRWVPGETHRHLGRQYRLKIGDPSAEQSGVSIQGLYLIVDGAEFGDSLSIERLIKGWRREQALLEVRRRVPICASRFVQTPVPAAISIRRMSTRWASVSTAGRMTINPDLVQAPGDAIDYVLTHELAHLLVPDHGARFRRLMDTVMPDHEQRKRRLERAMA